MKKTLLYLGGFGLLGGALYYYFKKQADLLLQYKVDIVGIKFGKITTNSVDMVISVKFTSIADLEARLLDNQLIQGIKIANIGDNYAINAIQAGMAADNALAASQAEFAKQLGLLLAPMVLGYSPNLPSGLPGEGVRQSTGMFNSIADAGGSAINSIINPGKPDQSQREVG